MLQNPASWLRECSQRAQEEQEGPTLGLIYRPRRPPTVTDVLLSKKTLGAEGHGSMSVVLWQISVSSVWRVHSHHYQLLLTYSVLCEAFHVLSLSLLPQPHLVHPVIQFHGWVKRVDKIIQLQNGAETWIPLCSTHYHAKPISWAGWSEWRTESSRT